MGEILTFKDKDGVLVNLNSDVYEYHISQEHPELSKGDIRKIMQEWAFKKQSKKSTKYYAKIRGKLFCAVVVAHNKKRFIKTAYQCGKMEDPKLYKESSLYYKDLSKK